MTIISFIAINFGAIYRTTKSSYRDSPNPNHKPAPYSNADALILLISVRKRMQC